MASREIVGSVLTTPRQCGPTSRIPAARQVATSCAVSTGPLPSSNTTSALTSPRAAHARAASRTSSGASASTASSTSPATSAIVRARATPAGASPAASTAWSAPVKPAPARLCSASPPAVPRSAAAATSSTDDGRSTCATAATAASRSRAPKRSRPSGVSEVGKRICSSPGCERTSTGKPESRKTPIMRWFSGSVIAQNTAMPSAAAASARCASRVVASPRPCHAPSTANATSASASPGPARA